MKEAIGTTLVFNIMMIFIGIIIVILIGSISYSKGFKIRNRIIDRIEEYSGYSEDTGVIDSIENDLKSIGYKIVKTGNCKQRSGATLVYDAQDNYNYCVYSYNTDKGNYYGVTVFISFEVPLIGNFINIPLYGETRVIYDKGQVQN